LDKLN